MNLPPSVPSEICPASVERAVEIFYHRSVIELGLQNRSSLRMDEKRMVIASVVGKGGLHFRNCVRDLARLLDLSRTTVYAVINGPSTKKKRRKKVERNGLS